MTGPAARIGRLWRTLRWLRREQWLGRARLLLLPHPRPDLRPAPALRAAAGAWVAPPAREASLLGPTRWRLLGETHDLAEIGWDDPQVALLWRYNQHYFDDLNAVDAHRRIDWQRALVQRWCDDNPPRRGAAWAPYPTSLRIVNWVKWFLAGETPAPSWRHSLAVQTRWLARRLEWHLLGNHLFANAKALVFAGLLFDGDEAEAWLATGLRILDRELPEQFLADGAQLERSPMYHALALEDLLDLLNLIRARAPTGSAAAALEPDLAHRASAALAWLRLLRHPGGALVRFNDVAEGVAPPTDAIEAYAAELGVQAKTPPAQGLTWLQPSGYARVARGAAVALLDLAPVGPDYLPGHAHADTLSFELSLHGRELVVNRGTSVYGDGPRRQLERGTAAHSTLQVEGLDSSEVWAGFRVGRRARVGPVRIDGDEVEASHDGYAHLTGSPMHQRRWVFADTALEVDDRVQPPRQAVARYHLAPGLRLHSDGPTWLVSDAHGRKLATATVIDGCAGIEPWQHAVNFGQLENASTLTVHADAQGCARVRWSW